MAIKGREEFLEGLKRQKPRVFILGEEVENVVEDPRFQTGINGAVVTYLAATDPRYQERTTLISPLIEERINRFTHIHQSAEDLLIRARLMRELCSRHICLMRCLTSDALNTVWATTFDLDRKYNTQYHQRFGEYVKYVQKNDLMVAVGMTDVKGDRGLRPGEQADPDLYLRIVERKDGGIVVRGAKANITGPIYSNEIIVMPCRDIRGEEKDYAVCFAVPIDTPGITFICRPSGAPREKREIEHPVSSKYGHIESLVVFEDVFVPWERVFMAGEWDFAGLLVSTFACQHRWSKCSCKSGQLDLLIGAAALIAEYNGIERAPHVRDRIIDMIMSAEVAYSSALASCVDGTKHPSGAYFPNFLAANVGKYLSCIKVGEDYVFLQEIGGGLVVTMPTEKDYKNPTTREYMEKYLKGKKGIPTEHRIRALKLIEDLTASEFAGWYIGLSVNAAGSPMAEKIEIWRRFDLEKRKKIARIMAGIEKED